MVHSVAGKAKYGSAAVQWERGGLNTMTSSVFYQIRNLPSTSSLSLMTLLLTILDPKEVVESFLVIVVMD